MKSNPALSALRRAVHSAIDRGDPVFAEIRPDSPAPPIPAKYTIEQLQEARVYAASFSRNVVAAIDSGKIVPNDPQAYRQRLIDSAERIEAGLSDGNFTVWQRMHYFLTGESVPLLAPKVTP
jgi:hypothetical protein